MASQDLTPRTLPTACQPILTNSLVPSCTRVTPNLYRRSEASLPCHNCNKQSPLYCEFQIQSFSLDAAVVCKIRNPYAFHSDAFQIVISKLVKEAALIELERLSGPRWPTWRNGGPVTIQSRDSDKQEISRNKNSKQNLYLAFFLIESIRRRTLEGYLSKSLNTSMSSCCSTTSFAPSRPSRIISSEVEMCRYRPQ